MKTKYFCVSTLIKPCPNGFVYDLPDLHAIKGQYVVLLADDLNQVLSQLGNSQDQMIGIIITVGFEFSHQRLFNGLYHLVITSAMLSQIKGIADFYVDIIEQMTTAQGEIHAQWIELKNKREQLMRTRASYDKTLDRLGKVIEELQNQKQRYQYILEGTNAGTWEWNVQTGETIFNENWAAMIGESIQDLQPTTVDTWIKYSHPEDIKQCQVALDNHFIGETEFYAVEMRMKHRDGHWIWILDRGKVISWTDDGKPLWMYGTHVDITEQKRSEEQIAKINSELQMKNKELEQVVYVASHDLKSPLVNISGFSREIESCAQEIGDCLSDAQDIATVRESVNQSIQDLNFALQYIVKSTAHMNSLLSGLLKLSRLGRESIHIESLNINDVVKKLLDSTEYQIRSSGIQIQIHDLPACQGDSVFVSQVFGNLINNAIKYLDPKRPGQITISGIVQGNRVLYCVEDNGIGIHPDHQGMIFEVFHRLEPKKYLGEGLGLSIVRQNLTRMSGSVRVESSVGVGSKFYVELPRA